MVLLKLAEILRCVKLDVRQNTLLDDNIGFRCVKLDVRQNTLLDDNIGFKEAVHGKLLS